MRFLVGRIGDIMNLGGVKVAPGAVEDALSSCSGVKEIAAFSMPDGTGNAYVLISAGKRARS